MELQGKLGSFVRVKAKLLKRLQRVWFINNASHLNPEQYGVRVIGIVLIHLWSELL